MSIFMAVYLSTSAMKGQYLCMYLVTLLFKSLSFHLSTGRLQSVLVCYCAAVSYFQNTRVSFASDSIPFNSHFFSMACLAYISLSVHQQADSFFSPSKSTFLFFIVAISLLFKSRDNVFLSILLHPFQWRVQGFSLSLLLSLCLSLPLHSHFFFSEGIWGTPERGASLEAQLSVCNEA